MLIDLDDDEIHRILECLDAKASSIGTDDSLADDCERIWRKIFEASQKTKS